MSVNALVVFKDGSTRVVEVPSPAPRDLQVNVKNTFDVDLPYFVPVTVFRPRGSDSAPIYEQP